MSVKEMKMSSSYEENPRWWSWRGRMSQGEYVIFRMLFSAVFAVLFLLSAVMSVGAFTSGDLILSIGFCSILIGLAYVWIGTDVRRFHDLGFSGWYLLSFYAIQIAIVVGIVFLLAGRSGEEVITGPHGRYFMVKKSAWTFSNCFNMSNWFRVIKEKGWLRWLIGAVNLVVFVFGNGTEGPNKYGPDPRAGNGRKILRKKMDRLMEISLEKASGHISEDEFKEKRDHIFSRS